MNLPIWPPRMTRIAIGISLGDLVILNYRNLGMEHTATSLWNPNRYVLENGTYELPEPNYHWGEPV